MPILGIMASSRPAFELVGSYDSLATVDLSATTSTVTFSGIPAGYKHLQLRFFGFTTQAENMWIRFGSGSVDSGTNYSWHEVGGDGSSTFAGAGVSADSFKMAYNSISNGTSPTVAIVDILDYANTSKYKTARVLTGTESNNASTGYAILRSGSWRNTAAVDTIYFYVPSGGSFKQYTSFALYGVK
jgi:hypothetical protein